jgi:hypothetical protein
MFECFTKVIIEGEENAELEVEEAASSLSPAR